VSFWGSSKSRMNRVRTAVLTAAVGPPRLGKRLKENRGIPTLTMND